MQLTTINYPALSTVTQDVVTLVALITIGAAVFVHFMVASAIINDSVVFQRSGRRLMFFGPLIWTMIGLMTGLFGLLAYWLMHHSSFAAPANPPDAAKAGPKEDSREVATPDEKLSQLLK